MRFVLTSFVTHNKLYAMLDFKLQVVVITFVIPAFQMIDRKNEKFLEATLFLHNAFSEDSRFVFWFS